MYIFSSHYIDSISAQLKNLKPHRGTEMHPKKKINLLACRSVLLPVSGNIKPVFANNFSRFVLALFCDCHTVKKQRVVGVLKASCTHNARTLCPKG